AGGSRVLWAAEGRSTDTWARAATAELDDAGSVASLAAASDVVLSVCPPHGALDIAREVAAAGFRGLYVDGNAIAPDTARKIAATVRAAGGAQRGRGGV